jgi:hypothetical protein
MIAQWDSSVRGCTNNNLLDGEEQEKRQDRGTRELGTRGREDLRWTY